MKRSPELRGLSKDHHRALVMAKKAKQTKPKGNLVISEIWNEMEKFYSADLEKHFRIEEKYIGLQLEAIGNLEIVERLYKEHAEIRAYFKPESRRTAETLVQFGELLGKHVRFEERELFNVAQDSLSSEALASIERACIK